MTHQLKKKKIKKYLQQEGRTHNNLVRKRTLNQLSQTGQFG